MQKLMLLTLFVLLPLMRADSLAAQSCLGLPSFADGALRLNASVELADSAKAYAAGLGAGMHNGLFGTIGGGIAEFDGIDEKSKFGFLELGFQLPIGRLQLCPVAAGTLGSGPDDEDFGIEVKTRGLSGGGAIGLPIMLTGLGLLPNAAIRYSHQTLEVEAVDAVSSEETFKTWILDLGVGFLIGQRLSIQPLVHIPVSGDDEETTAGIFVSFAFGPRSR